jgi:hypothetical protein
MEPDPLRRARSVKAEMDELAAKIAPLLDGKDATAVGALLFHLIAAWIIHHPATMRAGAFDNFVDAVAAQVAIYSSTDLANKRAAGRA